MINFDPKWVKTSRKYNLGNFCVNPPSPSRVTKGYERTLTVLNVYFSHHKTLVKGANCGMSVSVSHNIPIQMDGIPVRGHGPKWQV